MIKNSDEKSKKIRTEISAGGVVFRRLGEQILIGFILDPYNKWIFAKGHVERGEKIHDAAVRETCEEMGLHRVRRKQKLGIITFRFRFRGVKIHKTVHYYLMEAHPRDSGAPQASEKIKEVRWVPLAHAIDQLGYKNTRKILERAIEIISKEIKN